MLYEYRFKRVPRKVADSAIERYGEVNEPAEAAKVFTDLTRGAVRESFYALYRGARGRILGFEHVGMGTLDQVEAHPREVFRGAILAGAHSIVIGHNHPSGDPTPSEADREVSRRFMAAGELMGIPVLDHIVVNGEGEWESAEPRADLPRMLVSLLS